MGSKEEAVEAEPLEAGCSIVATDMSPEGCCCLDLFDLDRSRALDTRVGTSDRSAELIYALSIDIGCSLGEMFVRSVTCTVFQLRSTSGGSLRLSEGISVANKPCFFNFWIMWSGVSSSLKKAAGADIREE